MGLKVEVISVLVSIFSEKVASKSVARRGAPVLVTLVAFRVLTLGAALSTVTVKGLEAEEVLPAVSLALAE
jgi:hypothetical protein